jgi:hypothetical protein
MQPIPVFLSYSHRDEAWKDDLKRAVASLSTNGYITIWDDRKIPAGTAWEPAIEQHLREAQIVLVLITHNYVASEYCRKEFDVARAQSGRRVIPLFVKQVTLAPGDPILELQGLPRDMHWADSWAEREQNKPLALIAHGVLDEVYALRHPAARAFAYTEVRQAASRVEIKFVDRERQQREFADFWDVASWSRPKAPQIYLLPAMVIDCPGYFVERLRDDSVESLAHLLKGASKAAIDRVTVHAEPRYESIEKLQRDMARDLFEELGALHLWNPAQLSARPLATFERFRLATFVIIEQTIHTGHAGGHLQPLLSWYANTFWTGFSADAQLLIFLHLSYVPPEKVSKMAAWLQRVSGKPAQTPYLRLESDLEVAFPGGRANLVPEARPEAQGAPIKVLPQLMPIELKDIETWLRDFYWPPHKINEEAKRLYSEVRRKFGDTRLSYFYEPLDEFYENFRKAQSGVRKQVART